MTTATPSDALPGAPTVAATVPGFEVTTWFGIGAPKATPAAFIERLKPLTIAGAREIERIMANGSGSARPSPARVKIAR